MPAFATGDRVFVNISAGILPDQRAAPDWQSGTVERVLPSGMYLVKLDEEIGGRAAEKEAAEEHLRAFR